jgi:hypothetical protein
MRSMAMLLGLISFAGIAVFGAPSAEAMLLTQQQVASDVTLCVDVKNSSTVPGAIVWAFPCNGTIAEQWHFVGPQLQGLMPNRCLATKGGRAADGTQVILTTCTGGAGQSWGYDDLWIYLLNTDECLDSEPGANQQLVIHKCAATAPSQQWTLH